MEIPAIVLRDDVIKRPPQEPPKSEDIKREESITSVECLRSAKPAEDLSIKEENSIQIKVIENFSKESSKADTKEVTKIETVFEKLEVSGDKYDPTTDAVVTEIPMADGPLVNAVNSPSGNVAKVVADPPLCSSNLYSISGSPSSRISRRNTNTSSVFPVGCMGCKEEAQDEVPSPQRLGDAQHCNSSIDNTPKRRPSSSKHDVRSPVTGAGVQQEARRQLIKRKDGNPLLGLGYENTEPTTPSNCRVPPGGYSHGLW